MMPSDVATVTTLAIGRPKVQIHKQRKIQTSIFKTPVTGPRSVGKSNIEGDRQADLSLHGGRNKAIYVYSEAYYPDWAATLERDQLEPAQFGENLTVDACRDPDILIGATYRIGTTLLTVTQPRIPCFKLGIRLGDMTVPKLFWEMGALGFYMRVEKEGEICQGDRVRLISTPNHDITVRDLWKCVMHKQVFRAKSALKLLPYLDAGWRRRLQAIVAKTV